MMIFFVVKYRPLKSGNKLTRMMTETTITARESARAPETTSLKRYAIMAAMRTDVLRKVSAHTCWHERLQETYEKPYNDFCD